MLVALQSSSAVMLYLEAFKVDYSHEEQLSCEVAILTNGLKLSA
jgi:hypothetical protein